MHNDRRDTEGRRDATEDRRDTDGRRYYDARLEDGARRMQAIEDRLRDFEKIQEDLGVELKANTAVTAELRDIMAAARLGFKVIGWIGTLAKWAVALAVPVYALIHTIKTGGPPPHDFPPK